MINIRSIFYSITLLLSLSCLSLSGSEFQPLTLSEEGEGLSHKVIVEAPNIFRIAFENKLNYGLSQWFDLSNEKQKDVDISQNHTDYLPIHEQGALFNQCLNPHDLIGHVIAAESTFKDTPRSIRIIESSAVRVVLENAYHPMLGNHQNQTLVFKDTYTIYATGRIYITHKLIGKKGQLITEWRNSIIGLGDPSYFSVNEKGSGTRVDDVTFTDAKKNWKTNQWAGYLLELPKWKTFTIISNTKDTLTIEKKAGPKQLSNDDYQIKSTDFNYGWIRCDSVHAPMSWHKEVATYLFSYWDPKTPAPYTDWTSASILAVRALNNPHQGGGGATHGWRGYKRSFWVAHNIELKKDQVITQQYMINLGSSSNSQIPEFHKQEQALYHANSFLKPAHIEGATYSQLDGAYHSTRNDLLCKNEVLKPVFISELPQITQVTINGKTLGKGTDYIINQTQDQKQIIQLTTTVSADMTISLIP